MRRSIAFLFLLLLLPASALAQSVAGTWDGHIQLPGQQLEISVTFTETDGTVSGTIDIPAQGASDLPLAEISVNGAEVRFAIANVPGNPTFTGTLDGDTLEGSFTQGGLNTTFTLTRKSAEEEAAAQARVQAALDSIRAAVPKLMDALDVPGVAVGVVTKDAVLMIEGFGYRDVEAQQPVTPNTLFAIGSSTKAFTATLLGALVDEGLLDWDTPVQTYLPGFALADPFAAEQMAARDLLTHRSGLPRHDLMWYGSAFSREDIFQRLRHLESTEPFRTRFQYQNLMFMTAGYLAGVLTHSTWEEQTRQRLFQPLGMTHSNFSVAEIDDVPDFAYGYRYDDETKQYVRMPFRNIDAIGPAGSINAPLADMVKWAQFQLTNGTYNGQEIVSEGTLKEVHRPQFLIAAPMTGHVPITHYAMGWFVDVYRGELLTHHGGNIDGFSAMVAFLPQHNYGFVILTNKNGTPLTTLLLRTAVDELLGLDKVNWVAQATAGSDEEDQEDAPEEEEDAARVPGTSPSHPLADYAGQYDHPGYGTVTVVVQGDQLHVRFNGIEGDFAHYHYDVFQADSPTFGKMKVQFTSNLNGEIDAVLLQVEPALAPIRFTRKPDESLSSPDYLRQFTGKYKLAQGDVTISILLTGNTLKMEIPGQPVYDLEPTRENTFALKGLSGYSVRFEKENGTVTGAVAIQPNGTFRATKVE